jgi:hypothetical protein
MRHTLWSHGTLLGEFDPAASTRQSGGRTAPFWPTDAGLALMPAFVDVLTTAAAVGAMMQREEITRDKLGDRVGDAVYNALRNSPEAQRAAAARAVVDALEPELRDEAGQRVETGQLLICGFDWLVPGGLPVGIPLDGEPPGFSRYLLCAMDPDTGESADSR